jgi:hypothetical protein
LLQLLNLFDSKLGVKSDAQHEARLSNEKLRKHLKELQDNEVSMLSSLESLKREV